MTEDIIRGSIYFGFAISDSMFQNETKATVIRKPVDAEYIKRALQLHEVIPILNPSHQATIRAMKERFGIEIQIPEKPPKVVLNSGDSVLIMQVRGLPRLTDRREYTQEEIDQAQFSFSHWLVVYGG